MELSQNEVGIFKLRTAELPNCGHRAASAKTAHCGNPFCVVCALNIQRKATGSTIPSQERLLSVLVVVEGAFCEKPCPGLWSIHRPVPCTCRSWWTWCMSTPWDRGSWPRAGTQLASRAVPGDLASLSSST